MEKVYKQEIFFEEEEAKRFIRKLQDSGKRYQVSNDDYWDGEYRIPCIVIDYME